MGCCMFQAVLAIIQMKRQGVKYPQLLGCIISFVAFVNFLTYIIPASWITFTDNFGLCKTVGCIQAFCEIILLCCNGSMSIYTLLIFYPQFKKFLCCNRAYESMLKLWFIITIVFTFVVSTVTAIVLFAEKLIRVRMMRCWIGCNDNRIDNLVLQIVSYQIWLYINFTLVVVLLISSVVYLLQSRKRYKKIIGDGPAPFDHEIKLNVNNSNISVINNYIGTRTFQPRPKLTKTDTRTIAMFATMFTSLFLYVVVAIINETALTGKQPDDPRASWTEIGCQTILGILVIGCNLNLWFEFYDSLKASDDALVKEDVGVIN